MPQFAANLSLMYNEHDFLDRFAAAAADGFRGIEFLFPYAFSSRDLRARLDEHQLQQVLFNAPAGNWEAGERGLASLPGRAAEFRSSIEQALTYADELGCKRLHVMAGLRCKDIARDRQRATYLENLAWAAGIAAKSSATLLIEPINVRDMPCYFLNHQEDACRICEEIGAPNLRMQFDVYHCQIVEGDLSSRMKQHFERIAHIQIAGVPARNEPDEGEINFHHLFRLLDAWNYTGWVGCEYRPRRGTSEGLAWLRAWQGVQS